MMFAAQNAATPTRIRSLRSTAAGAPVGRIS